MGNTKICVNWPEILKECTKKQSLSKKETYYQCLQRMSYMMNCKIPIVKCDFDDNCNK